MKCIEDEIPFEVPEGWEWSRFSSVTINRDSERKPISLKDRTDIEKTYDYYGASGAIDKVDDYLFSERLLLIGEDGANLVTRTKPIAFFAEGKYWVNNHAHCIDATDKNILDFIALYINSINLEKYITGAAQPKMNQDNMNSILIPFPPIDEQIRISNYVNDLLDFIRVINYEKEELISLIDETKSKILGLAIRGQLVPQDPNDEPASVLLERISSEKEELIKQGKIKRDKKESIIFKGEDNSYYEKFYEGTIKCIDDEIPFDIPDTWEWCRLGHIFSHNTGKALNVSKTDGIMMSYITTSNLYWDHFILDNLKEMPFTENEIDKCTVTKGDLLVCEGGDIGRAAIWMSDENVMIQNHIHRLRPITQLNVRFYYFVFRLWKLQERIGGRGIGLQGFSSKVLHNMLVPLPPYYEQTRIVEFIDKIELYLSEIEKSLI